MTSRADRKQRKSRHRETEAVRRQRISDALDGLRKILNLSKRIEQATLLERTLHELQTAKAELAQCKLQLAAVSLQANSANPAQPLLSSQMQHHQDGLVPALDVVGSQLQAAPVHNDDLIAYKQTYRDLLPSAPCTTTIATTAPSLTTTSALSTPQESATSLSAASLSVLDEDDAFNSEQFARLSLDSFYLPSTFCIIILTEKATLDCNQATLNLIQVPSIEYVNQQFPDVTRSPILPDHNATRALFDVLKTIPTVRAVGPARRQQDGTIAWGHSTVSRLAGQAWNGLPVYISYYYPTAAPVDGLTRIWTSDTLCHPAQQPAS